MVVVQEDPKEEALDDIEFKYPALKCKARRLHGGVNVSSPERDFDPSVVVCVIFGRSREDCLLRKRMRRLDHTSLYLSFQERSPGSTCKEAD